MARLGHNMMTKLFLDFFYIKNIFSLPRRRVCLQKKKITYLLKDETHKVCTDFTLYECTLAESYSEPFKALLLITEAGLKRTGHES